MKRFAVTMLALLVLIAGCGEDTPAESALDAESTEPPERQRMIVGAGYLPGSLDPTQEGYTFVQYGLAETLTRVTPDQQIVPWLAETIEQVDDVTWKVVLHNNITFHDGSPVTADTVRESFERALETQAAAARFMDPETSFEVVDEQTLRFILPEPRGSFLNNLASFHFLIYKETPDGPLMTGPYRIDRFVPDGELEAVAYDGYWAGEPSLSGILFKRMADANARALALQSGEVHLVTEVASTSLEVFPDSIDTPVVASSRYQHMILNHQMTPFNDPAVRRAVATAINRSTLNEIVFNNLGREMTHLLPEGIGFTTPPELETGAETASRILDEAGWLPGSDGVREKDGVRLTFTIHTYGFRPELTPMAISIQDQLSGIGIDVEVIQVEDITGVLATGDFNASMFSVNMLPIGDPHYALNVTLGIYGYGGFSSDTLDAVVRQLQLSGDPDEREELLLEALQIMADEAVNIYLIAAPRIVGYDSDRVQNVTTHPNDLYLIDHSISVQ